MSVSSSDSRQPEGTEMGVASTLLSILTCSSHVVECATYFITVLVLALGGDIVNLFLEFLWIGYIEFPVENTDFRELLDRDWDRGLQIMSQSAVGIKVVIEVGTHP